MERNERPRRAMTRAAELFDLPADIVAGLCHLEMIGDRQLFLEGHGGILSYGTERIAHPARAWRRSGALQHDGRGGAHLRQDRRRGICEMRAKC